MSVVGGSSRTPLVATKSFTFVDRIGRTQTVTAGQTCVSPESEDFARFPSRFMAVDRAARSANTRSAPADTPPPVQLRAMAQLPNTVHMTRSIRLSLDSEAARSQDGHESGGFLVGRTFEHGVQVLDVLGLPSAKRGSRFIELDGEAAERFVAQFSPSTRIVGTFHTHPGASNAPSPHDLGAWAPFFTWYPECRASLLLVPELEDGWPWAHPKVHAYMLRSHRRDGSILVEPAHLEVA